MSKQVELVEDAVKVLRQMPASMQATAARAIIDYASGDDEFFLSDDQVAEVERRLADPNRQFMTVSEARDRLHHFGV